MAVVIALLASVACGRSAPLPAKIAAVSAPSASVSPGLPNGVPTALPDGRGGPSPIFWLSLTAYAPGDTFLLDFTPPDPSFDLHDPDFCGPADPQQCRAGGRYGKGPFYGMQLVGTQGHYRFVRVSAEGTQTVIAEGDVDVTHWNTVTAVYPSTH